MISFLQMADQTESSSYFAFRVERQPFVSYGLVVSGYQNDEKEAATIIRKMSLSIAGQFEKWTINVFFHRLQHL